MDNKPRTDSVAYYKPVLSRGPDEVGVDIDAAGPAAFIRKPRPQAVNFPKLPVLDFAPEHHTKSPPPESHSFGLSVEKGNVVIDAENSSSSVKTPTAGGVFVRGMCERLSEIGQTDALRKESINGSKPKPRTHGRGNTKNKGEAEGAAQNVTRNATADTPTVAVSTPDARSDVGGIDLEKPVKKEFMDYFDDAGDFDGDQMVRDAQADLERALQHFTMNTLEWE